MHSTATHLYTTHQIRTLESFIIAKQIDTESGLMHKAGAAAFQRLRRHWPAARSILVVCGKGNNAGDGFILARLAKEVGLSVGVVALVPVSAYQGAAKEAAEACILSGVHYVEYAGSGALDYTAELVVDAVLGIGIRGEVAGSELALINAIRAMTCPVLSIDIPSGLNADTGCVMGAAVQADVTVTFLALKCGLMTHNAVAYCGELYLESLQVPSDCLSAMAAPNAELIDYSGLQYQLPRRERDAHKGQYGHVLVIGGDYGMGGAVRMAAEAALRVGAGRVSVATRREQLPLVCARHPEIMCYPIDSREEVEPLLERASVVVLGPGLGHSDWAHTLWTAALSFSGPMLLDADALNILSQRSLCMQHWILTPHPAEAARLLHVTTNTIQLDRFASARQLQAQYGGVVVLKGAGTLIQSPDTAPKLCAAGNPGMASAGMGDVLSGVIGGLLAQGLSFTWAAEYGVLLHALAADRAAQQYGERGLLASDLMLYLRQLVNPE